jgi:hypothetical protein
MIYAKLALSILIKIQTAVLAVAQAWKSIPHQEFVANASAIHLPMITPMPRIFIQAGSGI